MGMASPLPSPGGQDHSEAEPHVIWGALDSEGCLLHGKPKASPAQEVIINSCLCCRSQSLISPEKLPGQQPLSQV
jgi:hypothetical protein